MYHIHYSEDYVTFRMKGSDRNGLINVETDNPPLAFNVGDSVRFSFEYDNSIYGFGIFFKKVLLGNGPIVKNNNNNTMTTIEWYPNSVSYNEFFYRSEKDTLMNGGITIQHNPYI